ncbi:methyltransferase domain-containing protein [Parasphingopyxis lamellibrachiae]|uniref:Methyltransferase family protein n=1 Tax=Parasphingopyxis lamellibrachiae TaxID=680125 RepID=A0A3D9FH41_9SPHN|nr:methyltransferase domain-containing protein [Parasphingopyxis lamellibrachiae]RED17114.1 methyltransferase family protein [Parasphingopyxis lamellibrachiae]
MAGLSQRAIAEEQMDAPGLAPDIYAAVLTDLERANRWTFAARPTLSFLARATQGMDSFSLLDVGYGEGGMLRAIAGWAKARGIEARLTGIDLNSKSRAAAEAQTPDGMTIDYRTGDYADCEPTDFIVSNLVAHHMTHDQLIAFLRHMEAQAMRGWMVNDLHRHRFAYFGYPLLARIMGWHPIVRADGRLSIARSYRPAEWQALLGEAGIAPGASHIVRYFPFRLCVERQH